MSIQRKIKLGAWRRQARVRRKINAARPRLSVFRSLSNIYGQIIDDATGQTLVSGSSLTKAAKHTGTKTEIARAVGQALAVAALAKGVRQVSFDRGSFLYHGRVKAFAEGLRAGGLDF